MCYYFTILKYSQKSYFYSYRFQTILSNQILCLCGRYYRWTWHQCFPGWLKQYYYFLIPASIFLRFFEEPKCSLFFQAAAVTGSGAKHDCDKEKSKIGHRRVNERGEITFKKVTTNHLMGSIQLGNCDILDIFRYIIKH